jgi:hypothetical protein
MSSRIDERSKGLGFRKGLIAPLRPYDRCRLPAVQDPSAPFWRRDVTLSHRDRAARRPFQAPPQRHASPREHQTHCRLQHAAAPRHGSRHAAGRTSLPVYGAACGVAPCRRRQGRSRKAMRRRSGATSRIGPRIRTSRIEDENDRCSGFEVWRTLQKFSPVHAQVHNHFDKERHLIASKSTSKDARPR